MCSDDRVWSGCCCLSVDEKKSVDAICCIGVEELAVISVLLLFTPRRGMRAILCGSGEGSWFVELTVVFSIVRAVCSECRLSKGDSCPSSISSLSIVVSG